jgi:hypothetical protein
MFKLFLSQFRSGAVLTTFIRKQRKFLLTVRFGRQTRLWISLRLLKSNQEHTIDAAGANRNLLVGVISCLVCVLPPLADANSGKQVTSLIPPIRLYEVLVSH